MKSFGKAFAEARKAKGPDKTFMWNGKSYSTNTAADKSSASKSSAPVSSPRPPAPGAKGAAKGRAGAAMGRAGAAKGAAAAAAAQTEIRSIRERLPKVDAQSEGKTMTATPASKNLRGRNKKRVKTANTRY